MSIWKIQRSPQIKAEITVPGDKSISQRAVILAGLSNGTCVIRGYLPSEDGLSAMNAMRALGVEIEQPEPTTLIVHGRKGKLLPPAGDIDCGNSGTAMRLLSGVLAAQPFRSRLIGDASLSSRPMKRVIDPLSQMGAKLTAEGPKSAPPLVIEGGELKPIHYHSPVASAQVKSAVLLAGLQTEGETSVTEPAQSRNHTERMLSWFQLEPKVDGRTVTVSGKSVPESRDFMVPGDISSAAFWMVAAAAQPGSHLLIKNVGLNPTRTGILDVLVRMGAQIHEVVEEESGEPRGIIEIHGARLKGIEIRGEEIPNVIDELPVLAVAAALAQGTTIIADAHELRVKETDRLAAVAEGLRAMGVTVNEFDDGLEIFGGSPLKGASIKTYHDHRIAMAFAIAGLFAEGETIIEGAECADTSYPGFLETLEYVSSRRQVQTPVIGTVPEK